MTDAPGAGFGKDEGGRGIITKRHTTKGKCCGALACALGHGTLNKVGQIA